AAALSAAQPPRTVQPVAAMVTDDDGLAGRPGQLIGVGRKLRQRPARNGLRAVDRKRDVWRAVDMQGDRPADGERDHGVAESGGKLGRDAGRAMDARGLDADLEERGRAW